MQSGTNLGQTQMNVEAELKLSVKKRKKKEEDKITLPLQCVKKRQHEATEESQEFIP